MASSPSIDFLLFAHKKLRDFGKEIQIKEIKIASTITSINIIYNKCFNLLKNFSNRSIFRKKGATVIDGKRSWKIGHWRKKRKNGPFVIKQIDSVEWGWMFLRWKNHRCFSIRKYSMMVMIKQLKKMNWDSNDYGWTTDNIISNSFNDTVHREKLWSKESSDCDSPYHQWRRELISIRFSSSSSSSSSQSYR